MNWTKHSADATLDREPGVVLRKVDGDGVADDVQVDGEVGENAPLVGRMHRFWKLIYAHAWNVDSCPTLIYVYDYEMFTLPVDARSFRHEDSFRFQ